MLKFNCHPKKISLVLSGGGARGIAHIGVIEELERKGFHIVSVTGTSMGALVGGAYALGKLEELKQWLFALDKLKMFGLVDFNFGSQGIVKGDKVFNKIREFIDDRNIEELPIPFAAVAVDIIGKQEVVFTTGSIIDAIRASVAIPTVLTPVKRGDLLLVDGGVLNNVPTNHAKRCRGDILVAVDVNAEIPFDMPVMSNEEVRTKQSVYSKKLRELHRHLLKEDSQSKEGNGEIGYFDLMNQTIAMMIQQIAMQTIEKYPPDVFIQISKQSCGLFDFYKAEEMVEVGRLAARRLFQ